MDPFTHSANPKPDIILETDPNLLHELGKTGKVLFNHPEGTHDDRFWALALAVYAAEQAPPPPSRPDLEETLTQKTPITF